MLAVARNRNKKFLPKLGSGEWLGCFNSISTRSNPAGMTIPEDAV